MHQLKPTTLAATVMTTTT